MTASTTTTVARTIKGTLGKCNIMSRRTALVGGTVYAAVGRDAYDIKGTGLDLYPEHAPIIADLNTEGIAVSIRLADEESPEYLAFVGKLAGGKRKAKKILARISEVKKSILDRLSWAPSEADLYLLTLNKLKEQADNEAVSVLTEVRSLIKKFRQVQALLALVDGITISHRSLEELTLSLYDGVPTNPGCCGEMLYMAGISLAGICSLEASGKIPVGSASFPAYITYLEKAGTEGHTIISASALWNNIRRVVPREYRATVKISLDTADWSNMSAFRYWTIGTAGGALTEDNDLSPSEYGHIGLKKPIMAEMTITRIISARHHAREEDWHYDGDLMRMQAIECSDDQLTALDVLLSSVHDIKILTGGPGTGKTTTLKKYLDIYEYMHPGARIVLCAPTGRAAQRMAGQTGRQASTIHKLLDMRPIDAHDLRPKYTSSSPIEADVLVVDESSMLTAELAALLLDAAPKTCTILMIGDRAQLQAIGAGAVLRDLLAVPAEYIPRAELTTQHRSDDVIGRNARAILAGDIRAGKYGIPEYRIFQVPVGKALEVAMNVGRGQVLAPKHAGTSGIDALNSRLQSLINPGPGIRFGKGYYREGDAVILGRNNYEQGYMNGDMGRVVTVNRRSMTIDLDGRQVVVSKGDSEDVCLSYAITVHKAQGSEFDDVTIVLPADAAGMVDRNLLYTAVTRARKSVTIITEMTGPQMDTYIGASLTVSAPRMTLLPWLLSKRLGCHVDGDGILGDEVSSHIPETA